jgi:hypothetical protein
MVNSIFIGGKRFRLVLFFVRIIRFPAKFAFVFGLILIPIGIQLIIVSILLFWLITFCLIFKIFEIVFFALYPHLFDNLFVVDFSYFGCHWLVYFQRFLFLNFLFIEMDIFLVIIHRCIISFNSFNTSLYFALGKELIDGVSVIGFDF